MDAITKIHEFEKFGSILGLERMTSLMHELGDPQDELKCIHVAGTNGKGSVCKYIYENREIVVISFIAVETVVLEVIVNQRVNQKTIHGQTDVVFPRTKNVTEVIENTPGFLIRRGALISFG